MQQANQALLKGAARVMDLYGSLNHYKRLYKTSDFEALRDDWRTVGQDLVTSINSYGSRTGPKNKKTK